MATAKVTNVGCELQAGAPIDIKSLLKNAGVQSLIRRGGAKAVGRNRLEIDLTSLNKRLKALAVVHECGRIVIKGETTVRSSIGAAKLCCSELENWGAVADADKVVRRSFSVTSVTGVGELGFRVRVVDAAKRIPCAALVVTEELLNLVIKVTKPSDQEAKEEFSVRAKVAHSGKVIFTGAQEAWVIPRAFDSLVQTLQSFKCR